MDKKKLLEMGFTEEQSEKIIKAHKAEIDGNYIPKHRFDEVNDSLRALKTEAEQKDKQIKELGSFKGDAEALKTKISELQESNKQLETQHKTELAQLKKTNAIKFNIAAEAEDVDLVLSQLDLNKVEIEEDGKIKSGFKEQYDALKTAKPFLFKKADAQPKPGFKPTGKKPEEGNPNPPAGEEEDAGVKMAKSLAADKSGAGDATTKANDYYFGQKTNK